MVSVIIPVFNAMPFLKETLASVCEQSYTNIEIIAIDDGSTDGSLEYLISLKHKNLIVKSNINKGACAARNFGLEHSTGAFIQYLDADDLLSKAKIQLQVEALHKKVCSIAVCNTKHFYDTIDNGKVTDQDFLFSTNDAKGFLLNLYGSNGAHNMVQTSAWLTPKPLIEKAGPWDETLSKDQDGEFFCRVASRAQGVIYVPKALNYYRKHVNGSNIASQKQRAHIESQLRALQSKSQQFDDVKHTKAYKNAMALQYKILAIDAYPNFKDVSKAALQVSDTLGGSSYLPVLGGRIIEAVKQIMGWRITKSLSYWIHKIR